MDRSYGEIIHSCRKSRKVSQRELGERTGITENMIGRYESEQNEPRAELFIGILNSLGYDIEVVDRKDHDA